MAREVAGPLSDDADNVRTGEADPVGYAAVVAIVVRETPLGCSLSDAKMEREETHNGQTCGTTMNPPEKEHSPRQSGRRDPPETRKVLVVDDSRDARSILQLLLTKLGHQAQTAEDAQTGIAISRVFQPEIVLCDLMMTGGMSGYAFAKAAREDQALAGVCIIAISGWDGPEYEREAYAAGFDRLLKKPVGLSDLQEILHSPPKRASRPACPPAGTDVPEVGTDGASTGRSS